MSEENQNTDGKGSQTGDKSQTMESIAAGITDPATGDKGASGDKGAAGDKGGKGGDKGGDNVSEMKTFIAEQSKKMESLANEVDTNREALTDLQTAGQQTVLNKAVDNAVAKINDGVNGDAKMADLFLNKAYQTDPNMKKIFDNRDTNPEALDKALGILKEEWKAMNENRIDSQVAENQRALQESQRQGTTPQQIEADEEMSKQTDGDFMRDVRKMAASA